MPEIELQRCPNCGGPAKLHTKHGKFRYECDGDCWTSTGLYSAQEGAAREWNRLKGRVPERDCLMCKHSMSCDSPDGPQLVCFCCAGHEGEETYVDEPCENYSGAWFL